MIKKRKKTACSYCWQSWFFLIQILLRIVLVDFVFFPYTILWQCNAVDMYKRIQCNWSEVSEMKERINLLLRSYISSVYTKHDSIFTLNKSCSYSSSCVCLLLDDIQVHARIITHGVLCSYITWKNSLYMLISHLYVVCIKR